MHGRWGTHFQGRIQKLQRAFSEWLDPSHSNPDQSYETIRTDLRFIANRRGARKWYRNDNSLELF
jgi:hypothetical protein